MAINYTFAQAVRIIAENKDQEAIIDIGRRFPLLMNRVSALVALAGTHFVEFAESMPEYLTALKVNNAMKATGDEDTGAEDADTGKAAEDDGEDAAKGGSDYDSMSGKELLALVRERKLTKKLPKPFKKVDMVKVLKEADADAGDEEAEAEDDGEAANPYEGMGAVELFKECKKRGLKVVPKKPAKYYIDLLTKDDAANASDDGEDDWGDEEAEEETSKPAAKAQPKKPAAKAATKKPAAKEADDDEDWDI